MSTFVRNALRIKYAAPEWALLEEVHNRTGGGTRSADAIAMNLWESNAFRIIGFEIKVSRSDWLRELKDPSKADVIAAYCDMWFIVATSDIVKEDELPPNWGLQVLKGNGLHIVKKAPLLEDRKALDRRFVAAMIRRATQVGEAQISAALATAIESERKRVAERVQSEVDRRTRRAKEIADRLEVVKAATGIDLLSYSFDGEDVSHAIRYALAERRDLVGRYNGLRSLQNKLRSLDKAIDELGELVPQESEARAT